MIGRGQERRRRDVGDRNQVLLQPRRVGLLARQLLLQLVVRDDPALRRVDQEDAARVQPLLDHDVGGRDVEHADFRRHHDEIVLGDVVARRPQAVAVEHGADHRAVGERQRRGAVPRLHQRGVVLVEGAQRRVHGIVVLPRLRDHHQDGVRQRPAGHHQQLEHVVEDRAVAAPLADDRHDLLQILTEQIGLEQRLARLHPVDVAAQRVDLAVVRDEAVGMGQRPRRERVGAEALVHQGQRRVERRIAEIGEHAPHLAGGQHALVDQRPRRQADDVEELPLGDLERVNGVLDALADHEQLALERRVALARNRRRGQSGTAADERPAGTPAGPPPRSDRARCCRSAPRASR